MKQVGLKVSHKGFLLVGGVLLLELLFLGLMAFLLEQAEYEAQEAEKFAAVANQINKLMTVYQDGATNYVTYQVTGSEFGKNRAIRAVNELRNEFRLLNVMLSDHQTELSLLKELETAVNKGIDALGSRDEELRKSGLSSILDMQAEFAPTLKEIKNRQVKLLKLLRRRADLLHSSSGAASRSRMKQLVWCGVGLSIAVAGSAVVLFSRQIIRRLAVVAENARRLPTKEELLPPVKGADEIAEVDQAFHDMAEALAEAAARERQALSNLQKSEARIRSIIEHLPVGILTILGTGEIRAVNHATEALFGYRRAELETKPIDLLFPEESEKTANKWDALRKRPLNKLNELRGVTSSGRIFPMEISLTEFLTEEGERYLVSILDITERHEVERLKREFVAMVSHDLRTPLTSIQGALELLAGGAGGQLPERALELVDRAEGEVSRLTVLVSDLLDTAKVESGKMDVNMHRVNISTILRRSRDSVRVIAARKNITITVAETSIEITADGHRLMQVVINLLSNAVKFSPDGGTVAVTTLVGERFVEVRVSDNGPGIAPEYKRSIFERFSQADDGRQSEGTGLGLAICKDIVDQHHGTIGVESTPGSGATFWFRLPLNGQAVTS